MIRAARADIEAWTSGRRLDSHGNLRWSQRQDAASRSGPARRASQSDAGAPVDEEEAEIDSIHFAIAIEVGWTWGITDSPVGEEESKIAAANHAVSVEVCRTDIHTDVVSSEIGDLPVDLIGFVLAEGGILDRSRGPEARQASSRSSARVRDHLRRLDGQGIPALGRTPGDAASLITGKIRFNRGPDDSRTAIDRQDATAITGHRVRVDDAVEQDDVRTVRDRQPATGFRGVLLEEASSKQDAGSSDMSRASEQ